MKLFANVSYFGIIFELEKNVCKKYLIFTEIHMFKNYKRRTLSVSDLTLLYLY